jgi:hypothetical protein
MPRHSLLSSSLLLLTSACLALAEPHVIFIKSFPGSTPAYVHIVVDRTGATSYKEMPDDDPETFQIEPSVAASIFDLAEKLGHFRSPLESGLKVAKMGDKTLRWENGVEVSEAKFNYSLDENAKALTDLFERISESERNFLDLRRVMRFDKLGVNDAMIRLDNLWLQKRLVATPQMLPVFDRVAANESFLHMARERAAELAQAIRNANSKASVPQ